MRHENNERTCDHVQLTRDNACEQHAQRARTARDDLMRDARAMANDTNAHGV